MYLKTFMKNNFGDLPLNRYLFKKINGKSPKCIGLRTRCDSPHLLISGSILSNATKDSIVWGAGFMQATDKLIEPPHRVYAVRGRLTWSILNAQGIKTPYIFGDPALLLPEYYRPNVAKKYILGIIPHYVDQKSPLLNQFKNWEPHIKIINILSEVESFIDQVNECEMVVSSTLHGLVVADAYQVPNSWIKITDKVRGAGFKFQDYFSGIGKKQTSPFILKEDTSLFELMNICKVTEPKIDLNKLIDSCPLGRVC